MPNWETFTLQGARGVMEKRVSLNVRGVFTLNQLAYDELGKPDAVELLYDKEAHLIGLKPSDRTIKYSYEVRRQGENKSYLIGARAFCSYYGIDLTSTRRFDEVTIIDGVMVLDTTKMTDILLRQKKNADDLT